SAAGRAVPAGVVRPRAARARSGAAMAASCRCPRGPVAPGRLPPARSSVSGSAAVAVSPRAGARAAPPPDPTSPGPTSAAGAGRPARGGGAPDPGRGERAPPEERRVEGPPARRPAASARRGKSDDMSGKDWDSLSDVDYWAELASDKPLTTTAQPAGSSARAE